MATTYEIELRPHVGMCAKDGELIEVEHDQWIVIAARNGLDPKQVGYLPKRPDAVLLPLSRAPQRMGPYLYGELCKAVEAARDAAFVEIQSKDAELAEWSKAEAELKKSLTGL